MPPAPKALEASLEIALTIAPVSMDTSDWVLNPRYIKAAEGARAELGRRFMEHMLCAAEHYKELSQDRFGRQVKHVLLFHANALVSDYLGALLQALKAKGARFISLGEALAIRSRLPRMAMPGLSECRGSTGWRLRWRMHGTGMRKRQRGLRREVFYKLMHLFISLFQLLKILPHARIGIGPQLSNLLLQGFRLGDAFL